jgi:hypothetical protein
MNWIIWLREIPVLKEEKGGIPSIFAKGEG